MTASPCSQTDILARHDQYLSNNYARFDVAMVRGQGSELWDADGKRYLDLFTGFGATVLGHCHPDLVAAVTEQANRLWHAGNQFHTEPQTRAAEAIANHGFGGRSFFCHSGADANEAAIKLARLYGHANPGRNGQRYKTLSATRSFHGRTFGTMPATGSAKVREGFGPMPPGYANVAYNDIHAMREALDVDTVAILVEPIQGEGGVVLPAADYFQQLRAMCDERDLLLICDEVWTGCGRTGKAFGYQHWGVEPDIMTLGKGVGGGMAVGVMCAQPRIAELYDWQKYGVAKHASTLGGNCLGMAVTAKLFEVIDRDGLLDRAVTLGEHATRRLEAISQRNQVIKDVRGKGLFIGVELDESRSGSDVVKACLNRGLVINATQGNVLRIAPAMTIEESQLDEGLAILEDVISS